jgi:hypothetical protein
VPATGRVGVAVAIKQYLMQPARCQSRSRRQQVTGLPQRAGGGARNRETTPASAAWSSGQGCRRSASWPRIMPLSRANSKKQSKAGDSFLLDLGASSLSAFLDHPIDHPDDPF